LHSRTRRLLTGLTLTLLAVACAGVLGTSKATAASRHATRIHKISACGYITHKAGTYELTKNVTNAGSGPCITLQSDHTTLYLDGHTITGTGTYNCIDVENAGTSLGVNETVIGGTQAKPTKTATLQNCKIGLYVYWTSGTMVSHLNIASPTSYGVYAEYAGGMTLSNINVALHANTAYGMYLEYGADNTVTKSTVDNNSSDASFYVNEETGDTFSWDTAKDTYSKAGNAGTGFYDYESARNTFTHDTSNGHFYGFYLYEDAAGPVTATYNKASGPKTAGSYGFYVYEAFSEDDSGSPFHTVVSHNKVNGFYYGFYDYSDSSYSVAEKWTNNVADNYTGYGFYIYYPTDYIFTGNIADGNTKTEKYDGSSTTYGIYIYDGYSYYPFGKFANNEAYDSEYGMYSDEYMVGGKGNIAKRNKYNSYAVEISG
jgi:parallel beta helix pectate lyase-like protein